MTQNPSPDLNDPALYINRELSWLEFNRRCLHEAFNPDLPLLERVRFLSIFSNNLDEFFMVRVSGLKDQVAAGITDTPCDGLTAQQQLDAIRAKVLPMLHEARAHFRTVLLPALAENGVHVLTYEALSDLDRTVLQRYFEIEVFPVLTPLAVDPGRPFPHISNLSLNLAVNVIDAHGQENFARIKVPNLIPRFVDINHAHRVYGGQPAPTQHRFIFLEDLIAHNLEMLFPGMHVSGASAFRITRNNDIEIAEEEASDLLESVEDVVRQRRFGPVIRLDVVDTMSERVRHLLSTNLELHPDDVYVISGPLGMRDLAELANMDVPALRFPPYIPRRSSAIPAGGDVFAAIRRGDILLHHPYESFSPVVEFFQQAAEDPQVLAIKCTLYRIGSKSPIVDALLQAIENGKQVAALVELHRTACTLVVNAFALLEQFHGFGKFTHIDRNGVFAGFGDERHFFGNFACHKRAFCQCSSECCQCKDVHSIVACGSVRIRGFYIQHICQRNIRQIRRIRAAVAVLFEGGKKLVVVGIVCRMHVGKAFHALNPFRLYCQQKIVIVVAIAAH